MNNNAQHFNQNASLTPTQAGAESNDEFDPSRVTVRLLKRQVDDLVLNFNKLAKTLNRPTLDEMVKPAEC